MQCTLNAIPNMFEYVEYARDRRFTHVQCVELVVCTTHAGHAIWNFAFNSKALYTYSCLLYVTFIGIE